MFDTKPIVYFFPSLVKEERVIVALREQLGTAYEQALKELLAGHYDGAGGDAHDIILDLVLNDSEELESLEGLGYAGAFPIEILRFGPLFWIRAPEFGHTGYFETQEDAVSYAEANWEPFISALEDEGEEE